MGKRRPWVLLGQLGMICAFVVMGLLPDPLENIPALMAVAFAVSSFGAIQDVATDGMAVELVPVPEQARANGFMWGAKTVGKSAALAVGTWILTYYNYTVAVSCFAGLVAVIFVVPLLLRERAGEKLLPWTAGEASQASRKMKVGGWINMFHAFYRVFSLRDSLYFAVHIFVASVAFSYLFNLFPVFTVQTLGWTDQQYAQSFSLANLIGGLGGMLIGGVLIDTFGKFRMLSIYFSLLIALLLCMAFYQSWWGSSAVITACMIGSSVGYVFYTVGVFAMAMQLCWQKVSATQFTAYMSLANLGLSSGALLVGVVKGYLDWSYTFFVFVVILGVSWMILLFVKPGRQTDRLDLIHAKDLENPVLASR